jgi:hypothetical protein
MPDENERKIIQGGGGVFRDLVVRIKLVIRLIADPRISLWLKLLPIGSVVYLVFPDLLPGPIDDVAIIWVGAYLFVELCPPDIVKEHLSELNQVLPGNWRDMNLEERSESGEVIEAEFREKVE